MATRKVRTTRSLGREVARAESGWDDSFMNLERRHRRATTTTQALAYQLLSCVEDGRIEAMVVTDGDGIALASSGDFSACEEIAARMVLVGRKINEFSGTLLGSGNAWQVQMRKIECEGTELLVCAVGGTADARGKQIKRGAEGTLRILQAA